MTHPPGPSEPRNSRLCLSSRSVPLPASHLLLFITDFKLKTDVSTADVIIKSQTLICCCATATSRFTEDYFLDFSDARPFLCHASEISAWRIFCKEISAQKHLHENMLSICVLVMRTNKIRTESYLHICFQFCNRGSLWKIE